MSTQVAVTAEVLRSNMPLLHLLFREEPPTMKEVIRQRDAIWSCGHDVAPDLFSNLIELAALHEKHQSREAMSYEAVAAYLGGKVLGGGEPAGCGAARWDPCGG